jgi:hypothetical protein
MVIGAGPQSCVKLVDTTSRTGDWHVFILRNACQRVVFKDLVIDGNRTGLTDPDEQSHGIQVEDGTEDLVVDSRRSISQAMRACHQRNVLGVSGLPASCKIVSLTEPTASVLARIHVSDQMDSAAHVADCQGLCSVYLLGYRRRQRLAFLGDVKGQDLHRRRSAGVQPFVHLPGRLLDRFPRHQGDRRLPICQQAQGALEDVGELLPHVPMFPRGRARSDLRYDDDRFFALHPAKSVRRSTVRVTGICWAFRH